MASIRSRAHLRGQTDKSRCKCPNPLWKQARHLAASSFDLQGHAQAFAKGRLQKLADTIREGKRLDPEIADVVANAMKDWAIENGATHYTHWFQPMTGLTAEKHDAFSSPAADGQVMLSEFSGKMLISRRARCVVIPLWRHPLYF